MIFSRFMGVQLKRVSVTEQTKASKQKSHLPVVQSEGMKNHKSMTKI